MLVLAKLIRDCFPSVISITYEKSHGEGGLIKYLKAQLKSYVRDRKRSRLFILTDVFPSNF